MYVAKPAQAWVTWGGGVAYLCYAHTDGVLVTRKLTHAEWLNRLNRRGHHIFGLTIGDDEIRCNDRRLRVLAPLALAKDLAHEWWHAHDQTVSGVAPFRESYLWQSVFLLRGSSPRNTWERRAYDFDEGWAVQFLAAATELLEKKYFG